MKRNSGKVDQNEEAALDVPDAGTSNTLSNDDIRRLRALTVLEHLTATPLPMTLAQLAATMQVPKSSLMRLLQAMEAQGYVLHMPAERGFVPGQRSIVLALDTLRGSNMRRRCRAVLRRLVDSLGESCNLTVPDGDRVLYVERIETKEPLRMTLPPGTWVPMHCSASGKLFLSSMPLRERQRAVGYLTLTRASRRTIVDRQAFEAELDRLAKRGIGMDNEELILGMVAVAIPVRAPDGKVVAAIACHAPTARMTMDDLLRGESQLRSAADEIAGILFPPEE